MTHIYEINDLVDFLDKHCITAEQFMYCLLLYNDKRHNRIPGTNKISRPLSKLYKYHTNVKKFSRSDLQDLIDKGFIEKVGKKLTPDELEITKKFEKEYMGDKFKFDQLVTAYPAHVANFNHPGGPKIPLTTMKDCDKVASIYNRFVRTYKLHDRIIEAVKWGNETGNINMSIERFVSSKGWEDLMKLRDSNEGDDNHEVI